MPHNSQYRKRRGKRVARQAEAAQAEVATPETPLPEERAAPPSPPAEAAAAGKALSAEVDVSTVENTRIAVEQVRAAAQGALQRCMAAATSRVAAVANSSAARSASSRRFTLGLARAMFVSFD